MVKKYDQHLSAGDVHALLEFYESPAGQHMLAAMPMILDEYMGEVMDMVQSMIPQPSRDKPE